MVRKGADANGGIVERVAPIIYMSAFPLSPHEVLGGADHAVRLSSFLRYPVTISARLEKLTWEGLPANLYPMRLPPFRPWRIA